MRPEGYRLRIGSGARADEPSAFFVPPSQVEENEGGAPAQTEETGDEQDVFDEQH